MNDRDAKLMREGIRAVHRMRDRVHLLEAALTEIRNKEWQRRGPESVVYQLASDALTGARSADGGMVCGACGEPDDGHKDGCGWGTP